MSIKHYPEDVRKDESIYNMEALMELLENDEISSEEEAFMKGYNEVT